MLGFIYNHSSSYPGNYCEHAGNFIKFLFLQYGESTSYFEIVVLKDTLQVMNANTFCMVLEVP